MSERFQIGLGKYVDDIELSQSIKPKIMEENVEIDYQQSNQCTSDNSYGSDNHSEFMSSARHKLGSKQSGTVCDTANTHDSTIDMQMKY